MKINNFRGELTDISAKKEALNEVRDATACTCPAIASEHGSTLNGVFINQIF